MKKTLHRIAVAYAYEWRLIRLRRQIEWWFEQVGDLGRVLWELLCNLVLAPIAIIVIAACAVLWLPYCFIFRPIKYGVWNGDDVDKIEKWKEGRKKQPLINTP